MKFYPPDNEPVSIGLTSGHTAVVAPEGTDLAPMFRKEAIAKGCVPDAGLSRQAETPTAKQFDRDEEIGAAIEAMLQLKDPTDFKADGTPNLNKLAARVGFTVTREEADRMFAMVSGPSDVKDGA